MPVLRRWLVAVLLLLFAGCPADEVQTPVQPLTTPQGPSQTEAEAKRDGVPKQVAAMTLDERTALDEGPDDSTSSVTTDDGVWRVSRPIKNYSEVLLLDSRREKIIKAVPLDWLAYHVEVAKDGIWVASFDRTKWVRIDPTSREIVERGTKGPSAETS